MLLLNLLVGATLVQGDDDARRLLKATEAIKSQVAAMDRFVASPKAAIAGPRGNRLLLSGMPAQNRGKAPLDIEVRSFSVPGESALTGAAAAKALVAALKKDGSAKSVTVKMLEPMDPAAKKPDLFLVKIRHANVPSGAEYVDSWSNSDGACWVVERKLTFAKG